MQKNTRITRFNKLLSLTLLALLAQGALSTLAAPSPAQKEASANSSRKLHRADFRVSGASCVACLRRIGKTLRDQRGVLTGDVSIFRPYWAVIVYDAAQTNMDKLKASIEKEKVKFEEVEDKPISSVPMIVIPKGMVDSPSNSASSSSSGSSAKHSAENAPHQGAGKSEDGSAKPAAH